ncbi:MAG: Glycosyl transferase, group 1 [uncultured Rubrobacteraceae bacterium]|uniref:Glycosyl transferase, group 1 n=1 Tax=uncultured Rubrobacteraceae bacterium TaxID=349277 RepID=A0A6J4QF13_9ACTN|nr:MAG: Glycosyl transferase, group 1 [uncultured Rubrobacteraceae bacterium]
MRLAMISEHASPLATLGGEDSGGQNVYVAELARRLGAMGHAVDVFTHRDDANLSEVVPFSEGVRVVNLTAGPAEAVPKDEIFPFMGEFRDAFYRFAEGKDYDLVHANFWMSGWVACEAKRDLRLPFAQTFHALGEVKKREQGEADTSPPERRATEMRILDEVDLVLATCPAEVEDLTGLYDADPERLTLVPCGVDAETFRSVDGDEARRKLGLPDRPTVVYVGRLVPRKGVDTLVRAFTLLPGRLDARLVIVGGEPGGSPEADRLSMLARELGIEGRVTFAGSRLQGELYHYYGAADVAVTVPHYEPFGMTPLEAMACATPVVGANVGGIKTSIAAGETGYLVPPKDPEALTVCLSRLLSDPALRRRMGRSARRRIEDHYTWESVATLAATAFSKIIREAAPRVFRTA